MRLKQLIPLPLRDLLRRPYYSVINAPSRVHEARLFADARRQFLADGKGVRVEVIDDFAPRVGLDSFKVFREYHTSPEMRQEVRQYLNFVRSAPGPTRLVDVGAHFGLFAIATSHAGKPGSAVLALEPSPPAFEELSRNLDLLGSDSVTPLQVAVGDAPGEMTLHIAGDGRGMMGVLRFDEKFRYESRTVPVVTLDGLCAERGFAPTALKIDVEGFEREVLRGASRVLAEHRPTIFLELHGLFLKGRGFDPREVIDFVRDAGYRVEAVTGHTDDEIAAVVRDGAVRRFVCEAS